jgi:sigma-B regulation protein RsbU (phosphoserine phosphatase)
LELQPGDAILFASDGILEAENIDLEEFGVDRLSTVLAGMTPLDSASDIADKIVTATDQHVGQGLQARDDRTLLVLRSSPTTPSLRFLQASDHLIDMPKHRPDF